MSPPTNESAVPVDGHIPPSSDCFQQFVSRWAPSDLHERKVYLEPLLAGWLYDGPGVESTAANYDHFLQVVMFIIDAILKGTLCLDYRGPDSPPYKRRMIGLQDPALGANVLSRMGFDQVVHQTLEGRRSEELRRLTQRSAK